MKKNTSLILKILLFGLVLFSAYTAKNSILSDGENDLTTFPKLLQRGEKIQMGKEWDYVQNKYSELRNDIYNQEMNAQARIELAQLFIKEARITGEHGHYYPAALALLDEVLKQKELNRDLRFVALMNKAGVQLSLHEFAAALETGNEAALINPSNAQIHGVLVDANVELGNYKKAVVLADRMINIKPDIRSYSRVSYLREIYGDVEGSIEAMKLAAQSGYPGYEETAWAMLTLGDLLTEYGQIEEAEHVYNEILKTREDYPFAVGALANLYKIKGDLKASEETYLKAMQIIPEVGFYVSLAEIYKEQGRNDELLKLMNDIFDMLKDDVESGHNMNLEYAHIYLDILDDADKAQKYIQREYDLRPNNIDVNLMMARVLDKKGDVVNQKKFLAAALKTNSKKPDLIAMSENID